jgi:hypothetical protein
MATLSPFSATWRNDVVKKFIDAAASVIAAGYVVGPASSTNNNLAAFNGTTGKLLKDSGIAIAATTSFTPTLAFATPNNSSWAYGTQLGNSTRFGPLVLVDMVITATPTIGTGSGNLIVGTLPIAVNASSNGPGPCSISGTGWTWPAGRTSIICTKNNSTSLNVTASGTGVTAANLAASNMTSGANHSITLSFCYFA